MEFDPPLQLRREGLRSMSPRHRKVCVAWAKCDRSRPAAAAAALRAPLRARRRVQAAGAQRSSGCRRGRFHRRPRATRSPPPRPAASHCARFLRGAAERSRTAGCAPPWPNLPGDGAVPRARPRCARLRPQSPPRATAPAASSKPGGRRDCAHSTRCGQRIANQECGALARR